MKKNAKIFIAGNKSITGAALIQYFKLNGFNNIFSESVYRLNLTDQGAICTFFRKRKPEYVFLTHPISGGIIANMKYLAEFIYNNLQIQNNIIHSSYKFGVKKLLFLGSSCVYPKDSPQPIKEEYLLRGELEKTSEPYAIAKIAGIKMCEAYNRQYGTNFIAIVPATIYGPEDDFNPETAHVISALIKKFHDAKEAEEEVIHIWGSGKPKREFIFVDDLVKACFFLLNNYKENKHINVGSSKDYRIRELAEIISDIIGFKGKIIYDRNKPDGVKQKLLDSSRIASLGWKPKTSLKEGIDITYNWLKKSYRGSKK